MVFYFIYLAYEASERPRICTTLVRIFSDFMSSSLSLSLSLSSFWLVTSGGRCVSQRSREVGCMLLTRDYSNFNLSLSAKIYT